MSGTGPRDGFSLVEVMIAMLILTVGVLAMGASTGFVLGQVRAAELRTERVNTVRQVAERLRATDWSDLPSACQSLTSPSARYSVECEVSLSPNLARLQLISEGPSITGGEMHETVRDTLVLSLARPVQ